MSIYTTQFKISRGYGVTEIFLFTSKIIAHSLFGWYILIKHFTHTFKEIKEIFNENLIYSELHE